MAAGCSAAVAHFEQEAYFVDLSYNALGSADFDQELQAIDLRASLAEAKAAIGTALQLEPDAFHLRRCPPPPKKKT